QEAPRRLHVHGGVVRQRGHAAGRPGAERRSLSARRGPRRGGALQAAIARHRQEKARGNAPPDAADPLRPREVRPPVGVRLAERDRAPRGGARLAADRPGSVVGASGGRAAQSEVIAALTRRAVTGRCRIAAASPSAAATAFAIAAPTPDVPASPAPLTPSGFEGAGAWYTTTSTAGARLAVGSA